MTASTHSQLAAALTICGLTVGGCALRQVDSYLARNANLASYRTYAWRPVHPGVTGDVRLDSNEMFQECVRAAVDKQLSSRGFEKTAAAPQLLVHYHASVEQLIELSELEPWEPCAECKPFIYDAGTLMIDLIDARTNSLLWRGWSQSSIDRIVDNQQWLEKHIDETVAKIFERLPFPLSGLLAPRQQPESAGVAGSRALRQDDSRPASSR
jgi:hypothetical protein